MRRQRITDKRMTDAETRYAMAYLRWLANGASATEPSSDRWLGAGQDGRAIQIQVEVLGLVESIRETAR